VEEKTKSVQRALVLSGGGMQCAYVSGILSGIKDKFPAFKPDLIIAESGSAGSATYFLAGQKQHEIAVWMAMAENPRLVSLFRNPVVDIDYLVDVIIKERFPLDLEELRKSSVSCVVPVIEQGSGKTVYLGLKKPEDVYTLLKAAMAMPFVYGKTIQYEGTEYTDGGFGSCLADHVHEAERRGATEIIVVRVSKNDGLPGAIRSALKMWVRSWGFKKREGLVEAIRRELYEMKPIIPRSTTKLVTLIPSKDLSTSLIYGSRYDVRTAMNTGYDDAMTSAPLDELLADFKHV